MKGNGKPNLDVSSKEGVVKMFDEISGKYEITNTLLSCGIDRHWRNILSRKVTPGTTSHLDLATGTGQVLIKIAGDHPSVTKSCGLDPSEEMLKIASQRAPNGAFVKGIAEKLPFEEGEFDLVTMSFGIRNTKDPKKALSEMNRVLKKEGQLLIMEFSLPKCPMFRGLYLFYLKRILPTLGGLFTGKREAYQYLSETIRSFPQGKAFEELLKGAGFSKVKTKRLTLGVVSIYEAFKQ